MYIDSFMAAVALLISTWLNTNALVIQASSSGIPRDDSEG